jgi:hypothetical protein
LSATNNMKRFDRKIYEQKPALKLKSKYI